MFTQTHSNSSTSPSQGSGSNVCQSSTKTCENVSNPREGIQRGKNHNDGVQQLNQMLQQRTSLQLNCNGLQKQAETTLAFHSSTIAVELYQFLNKEFKKKKKKKKKKFLRKQIQHLLTNQLHHADEQICFLANEWSSKPQHYLESTCRSAI